MLTNCIEELSLPLSPSLSQSARLEALERNLVRLNGGVELLSKLERKHQWVPLEGELPALHRKQGHAKPDLIVQDFKNYIPPLEEKICKSTEECKAKAQSYFAVTSKV